MVEKHESALVGIFDQDAREDIEKTKIVTRPHSVEGGLLNFDRICRTVNDVGRAARIGASGKYCCGGRLEPRCGCCDGNCGPNGGCNCLSCMKLDVKSRLLPKEYLVNSEGRIARKGQTGKFYCGGRVLVGVANCDGWCGPTNGPSCPSCSRIDAQSLTRYKTLM